MCRGWLVGCRVKANGPLVRSGPVRVCPPWGFFQGILARIYASFGKKNHGNSERLGRQARPGIEPGPSYLLALSAESLRPWWSNMCRGG